MKYCSLLIFLVAVAVASNEVDIEDDLDIKDYVDGILNNFDKEVNDDFSSDEDLDTENATVTLGAPLDKDLTDPDVVGICAQFLVDINRARKKCNLATFTTAVPTSAVEQITKGNLWNVEIEATDVNKNVQVFQVTFLHRLRAVGTFKFTGSGSQIKKVAKSNFRMKAVAPAMCSTDSAPLVQTAVEISEHNSKNLGWQKKLYSEFFGKTVQDVKGRLGLKIPDRETLMKTSTILTLTEEDIAASTTSIPPSYNFAASYPLARATSEINDQGTCGSCYAQSSTTVMGARIYLQSNGATNIKISAEEAKSCTSQCNGGSMNTVYDYAQSNGLVESWCDPETQAAGTCSAICANGVAYTVTGNTVMDTSSLSASAAVTAIQNAIIAGGPITGAFNVYSDFYNYASGVYSKAASATLAGGHAISILGWGTLNGQAYWYCQNSWGSGWGLNGYFMIAQGVNMCGIETQFLVYPTVQVAPKNLPATCKNSCLNAGSIQKDCTCRCNNAWTGANCQTCALTCQNGGVLNSARCSCTCPPGTQGVDCSQVLIKLSTNVACLDGSGAKPMISWNTPSSIGTTCYLIDSTGADDWNAQVALCGASTSWSAANPNCPQSGSAQLIFYQNPTPAVYTLGCMAYLGVNEFGQDKGYSIIPGPLGTLTVKASGCSSTAAPTTAAPTTKAPTTAAPTTKAPTTAAPTTKAPTTAAPTTKAPTTAAPTTKAPTTAAPTTKAPTTAAPTATKSTTKATASLATKAPTTKPPVTQKAKSHKTATKKPKTP